MVLLPYPADGADCGAPGRAGVSAPAGAPTGRSGPPGFEILPAARPRGGELGARPAGGGEDTSSVESRGGFRGPFGGCLLPAPVRLGAHPPVHCAVIDGLCPPDAEGRRGFHEAVGLTQERIAKGAGPGAPAGAAGLRPPRAARPRRAWEGGGGFSGEAARRVEVYDRAGREQLLRPATVCPAVLSAGRGTGPDRPLAPSPARGENTAPPQAARTPGPAGGAQPAAAPAPPKLTRGAGAERPRAGASDGDGGWHRGTRALGGGSVPAGRPLGAEPRGSGPSPEDRPVATVHRSYAPFLGAMRLARISEVCPRVCPRCGAPRRILAFVTDTASVTPILQHWGEPTPPPPVSPARGPPPGQEPLDPSPAFDASAAEPAPGFEFDPTVSG
jgi:hypothetical protein